MKSFHFLLFGLVLGCIIEDLEAKYLLVEVDANPGNELVGTPNNSIMFDKTGFPKNYLDTSLPQYILTIVLVHPSQLQPNTIAP